MGVGGPLLVPGVAGFEALAFGGQLCGEGCGAGRGGVVVLGLGVGGLLVGVGFGLGGEPQLAADVGRGDGTGAFALEGSRFELAAVQAADDVGFVADLQGGEDGLAHGFEFGVAAVRLKGDGLVGVGDPGGFPVGGGDAGAAGVFLAQCGGRAGGEDAELAGEPGLWAGGQAFAEGAGPVVEGGGELVGDRGALTGVRWAQVTSCRRSGRASRWRRPCRTLVMDRARSIGAAVIWSMRALMSCPASWAARSCCWRACRECSRSYRQASDSVSLALICSSICRVQGLPDGSGPQVEQVAGSA